MRLNDPSFPLSSTNPELTDKALGVVGGLVKLMTFQQIKDAVDSVGGSVTVEDVLTSTNTANALSAAQGKALNTALSSKAALVSPAFTGNPTAPTAAAETDNNEIATTAFVHDITDPIALSLSDYCPLVDGKVPSANLPSYVDGLATAAQAKAEYLVLAASDESTALTTGTGKVTFRMPYALTLTAVRCSLTTAQTSGSIFTVDINDSGTTILSTKLTIDNTEKTSTTADTAAVISDVNLADDTEITIDIDQVGDGTAKGLKVVLIGLINPFMVNYEFNGTDGDTTTTDSTGNTTASGLGIVSGSEFAYIQSNNLFAQNNYTTIDDSGALSPYLIFAGDFEIEVALRFSGNWNFYTDVILWQLEDALGVVMELFVNTVEGRIGLVGNPLSLVGGSVLISGSGAVPDLSTQQVFKVTRVGSTISIYVDNVFKASATSTGTVNAGRFKFFTDYFERYVDYLRIKKA